MKSPQMILFDYGQTLVQENGFNEINGYRALYPYITQNPRNLTPEQMAEFSAKVYRDITAVRGLGYEIHEHASLRLVSEYLGITYSISLQEAERTIWNAAVPGEVMPDTKRLLTYIYGKGIRSAVISNIGWSGGALTDRINHFLPGNHFEFIIASSEYAIRKPNPMIFELALQKAGLNAGEVWFCGDNPQADVEGAAGAGIFPVWYDYPMDCDYRDKTRENIPDCKHLHIQEWAELINILENGESRRL